MNEIENPYILHLTEMKAREKSSDIREVMDYIIAETKLREMLYSLQVERIYFREDLCYYTSVTFDFIVNKGRLQLGVVMVKKSEEKPNVYKKMIEKYPFIDEIAVVDTDKKEYPTHFFFDDECVLPFKEAILTYFEDVFGSE